LQIATWDVEALRMGLKLKDRWRRAREIGQFLYVQRVKGFDSPESPHFDDETREWFETRLRAAKSYLEFGAGGSTVLAAKLGIPTISVEGDPYYAKAVRRALAPNAPVTFLTPWLGLTTGWSRPLRPSLAKAKRYVSSPFRKPWGQFPDFILVDGRYRVSCALESARQTGLRGARASLLVDDYGKRRQYRVLEVWLGQPRMIGRSALFEIGQADISKRDVAMFFGAVD
jgi:hypothetical protein